VEIDLRVEQDVRIRCEKDGETARSAAA